MRPIICALLVALGMIVCAFAPAIAMPPNLHGNIHVTGVSSEQDSMTTESINQEYSLYWSKNFTQWVQLRAAMRYNHFGVEQTAFDDAWRRRFLPTVDLAWNHPLFDFTMSWLRQETQSSNDFTDLTRTGYGAQWKSKIRDYPIVTLRWDRDHTYNENNLNLRDTKENRYQLAANYNWDRHLLYYTLSLRNNENRPTSVEVTDISHLFRWNQTSLFFDKKVRFASGYNFSHRRSSTDIGSDTTVLDPITIVRAIYAEDATPDIGALFTRSGLTDGNTDNPVQPPIDLGQSQITHNIGIDFGFSRRVDGIYIYTDRPSGASLTWQVYVSGDNNSWQRVTSGVDYVFNASFNRYEITFQNIDARYIKAVSGGINEISTVLVTEIVPLILITDDEVTTRSQTSHQVDLATTYYVSEKVTTTFDVTYQAEPGGEFSSSRDQLYYSASLSHEPFSTVTQIFKVQSGFEKFELTDIRNENLDFFYTLLYEPLSTLDFTFSTISRSTSTNDSRNSEINNVFLQTNGKLLETVSLSGEVGYSRSNRFEARTRFDTWTYRITGDVALLRSLHTTSSYLYQSTDEIGSDSTRVRQQYSVSGTWRLTRTILARGQYSVNEDENLTNTYQDYSASWNASRRLSFGALYTSIRTDTGDRSERYNGRVTLSLSTRTSVFFSYNSTEFTLGDRPRVEAFQLGIRSGF